METHEGEDHQELKQIKQKIPKNIIVEINEDYTNRIKPIFLKKCFDCHSSESVLPWYGNIPIIGNIIKNDKTEGLKHLDLTPDFPFSGHGTPETDLKAILKSVVEDTMPPLEYKIFHWGSGLAKEEKDVLLLWLNESLIRLNLKGGYMNE